LLFLTLIVPAIAFAASCPSLTRNLSRGMSGDDVKALQQFLIDQNFLGSGYDTGYFGPLTETAVKDFQCDKHVVCDGTPASTGWGVVGPKTRAAIAETCSHHQDQTTTDTHTDTTTTIIPPFAPSGAGSCEWSGRSVANGETVTAYRDYAVPSGSTCLSEERTCRNGDLSGSYRYSWCAVELAGMCTLDNIIALDSQYQTFYSYQTVPSWMTCNDVARMRQCFNGTFIGPAEFRFASCSVSAATTTTPAAPTGLRYSCASSGESVTLRWDPMPGAATYGIRLLETGTSTFTVINDWYVGTSFTTAIKPDVFYSWWIHANPNSTILGLYSVGDMFKCSRNGG